MKILFLYPNTTNWPSICSAIPILNYIANQFSCQVDYFDTYNYKKQSNPFIDKEITGGFKPGFIFFNEIKDYNTLQIDLQNKINQFNPDLIVISCMSHEYEFLIKFFKNIIIPKTTLTIIGGLHAMLVAEDIIKTKLFNIVAFGEAESIFPEILNNIKNNKELNIQGTFTYIDNKIKKYNKRLLLSNEKLYNIGLDFSIYSKDYFIRPFDSKMINRYDVEISRGCPYNCTYCGNSAIKNFYKNYGQYVKTKPINLSIEVMQTMINKYNINIFQLTDECFMSHSVDWLKSFMDQYKKINKPFIFQTRAETITEQKIQLLLSYNIPFQASIGVESGSEKILKLCNRKCSNNQVLFAFKLLNKYHIRTNAFFMIGFPFETRKDYFKSVMLYREIKPSVASVAIFQPLPGQEAKEICLKNNFIIGNEDIKSFTEGSILNMPKPYLQNKEIYNLWRVFNLYANLPYKYWKDIHKCEINYKNNKDLFNNLINVRWSEYDYSKIKGDIKLL